LLVKLVGVANVGIIFRSIQEKGEKSALDVSHKEKSL
jgi:hypothetical protein